MKWDMSWSIIGWNYLAVNSNPDLSCAAASSRKVIYRIVLFGRPVYGGLRARSADELAACFSVYLHWIFQ